MTSKDFRIIAGVISNLPRENGERMRVCQAFCDDLRIINPRFNERIFMDACRVQQILIPAHRVKVKDFIPQWGEVTEIRDSGETILIRTNTCDLSTDEWAMDCDRIEPVRIERLNDSHNTVCGHGRYSSKCATVHD